MVCSDSRNPTRLQIFPGECQKSPGKKKGGRQVNSQRILIHMVPQKPQMLHHAKIRNTLRILIHQNLSPPMSDPQLIKLIFQPLKICLRSRKSFQRRYPLTNRISRYSREDLFKCRPIETFSIPTTSFDNRRSVSSKFVIVFVPLESVSSSSFFSPIFSSKRPPIIGIVRMRLITYLPQLVLFLYPLLSSSLASWELKVDLAAQSNLQSTFPVHCYSPP